MTTNTTTTEHETALQLQELPALTSIDRAALSLGTQLILWGGRHRVRRAERGLRAEQARIARAQQRAAGASRDTFERRAWAGPRW